MNSFFEFPQRLIELDKKAISMAEEQFDNISKDKGAKYGKRYRIKTR